METADVTLILGGLAIGCVVGWGVARWRQLPSLVPLALVVAALVVACLQFGLPLGRFAAGVVAGSVVVSLAFAAVRARERGVPARRRPVALSSALRVEGVRSVRLVGGAFVAVPGQVWTGSRPLVVLELSEEGFVVSPRFRFLQWTGHGVMDDVPPIAGTGPATVWAARWSEISEVRLSGGRIGVRTAARGACRFSTGARGAGELMREVLERLGVAAVATRPTRGFVAAAATRRT